MPDDDTNHLEMLCAQFLPDFKAAQLRIAIARNMLRANDGILLGDESALQRAALWLARHAVNARFDELKREVGRHIKQRGSLLVEANHFLLHRGLGLPEIAGEYGVSACRKDRAKSHRNADWSENTSKPTRNSAIAWIRSRPISMRPTSACCRSVEMPRRADATNRRNHSWPFPHPRSPSPAAAATGRRHFHSRSAIAGSRGSAISPNAHAAVARWNRGAPIHWKCWLPGSDWRSVGAGGADRLKRYRRHPR